MKKTDLSYEKYINITSKNVSQTHVQVPETLNRGRGAIRHIVQVVVELPQGIRTNCVADSLGVGSAVTCRVPSSRYKACRFTCNGQFWVPQVPGEREA